jgi:hypothetical protein
MLERGLVPVRSPADLRLYDQVMVRDCRTCGGHHVHALLIDLGGSLWRTSGRFHGETSNALDVRPAIAEGRLCLVDPGARLALRTVDEVGDELVTASPSVTDQIKIVRR